MTWLIIVILGTEQDFFSLIMPKEELSHYDVTEDKLVSLKGCDEMDHPLFGKTKFSEFIVMRMD